jgi:hypothetical protein
MERLVACAHYTLAARAVRALQTISKVGKPAVRSWRQLFFRGLRETTSGRFDSGPACGQSVNLPVLSPELRGMRAPERLEWPLLLVVHAIAMMATIACRAEPLAGSASS